MSYRRHNHFKVGRRYSTNPNLPISNPRCCIAQEINLINEEKKLDSEHAKMITLITQLLRHLDKLRKELGNHPEVILLLGQVITLQEKEIGLKRKKRETTKLREAVVNRMARLINE